MMNKAEAYRIVFNELKECNMFRGIYDAKNGNENFMHGISTVMEVIAMGISEKTYTEFANEFISNMIESEDKIR